MAYVDAIYDPEHDKIHVAERVNGKRELLIYNPKYEFYYDDPVGKYTNVFGNPVSKIRARSKGEFRKEVAIHNNKKTYESDINVCHYLLCPTVI